MSIQRVFKTKEEFALAIAALSPSENARLRQAAFYVAQVAGLEADDLLQEAIVRGVAGKRRWPDHIDVITFLAMVMKSLASAEHKRASRRPERDPNDEGEPDIYADLNPEGLGRAADEILIDLEQRQALLDIFKGDDDAQLIVEGMLGGMEGEELRRFVELESTEYASKRRKIRRALNRAYGAGRRK